MVHTNGHEPHEIGKWGKAERDSMLRKLKELGLSSRQIERVTGFYRGIIAKKVDIKGTSLFVAICRPICPLFVFVLFLQITILTIIN